MAEKSGFLEFIEWLVARKLAVKTVEQYARHYKLFEKELGEKQLTQNFLDRFVIKHPSNISRYFLKNLFEFYEFTDLEIPKVKGRKERKIRQTIAEDEIHALRSWLYKRGRRFGLMFDLTYDCALRREEIISVKIRDFQLDHWAKDRSKRCKLKIHGKGAKERYVMVHPKIMIRLVEWLQNKNKIPIDKKLFGVGKSKWHDVFKEAIKQTGLHDYTLHDLRRSRATYWINNGVDIVRVKQRLGHSSIATTQKYINPEEEQELKKWENED